MRLGLGAKFTLAVLTIMAATMAANTLYSLQRSSRFHEEQLIERGRALGRLISLVSPDALRIIITVSALVVATLWLVRLPPPLENERRAVCLGGLIGGFLNGSTSMGGPPPALAVRLRLRRDTGGLE